MESPTLRCTKAVVFHIDAARIPSELSRLLPTYRLMVNQALRIGLAARATSLASLTRLAYGSLFAEHKGLSSYIVRAINDAIAILQAHRKRERHGKVRRLPYVRRLFIKVDPASFHVDPTTSNLRVSVGNGAWVMFGLPFSPWHRDQLAGKGARPVLLTIKPHSVTIVISHDAPQPFQAEAIMALDTNEESLDGVLAAGERSSLVRVPLVEVRAVQARHFVRRRRIAVKKGPDRRVRHRLLRCEGKREGDRVNSRLHLVSKGLVMAAQKRKAVIVLEDLVGIRRFFSRRLNRRLSVWPHRELHRQIAYKAAAAGVPVVFINPYLTSQRCAMCGWTPKRSNTRRSARRTDGMFVCGNPECSWRANRQFNAGINILRTALAARPGLGGVRFHLDALSRDVMNPLCGPAWQAARGERMERESHGSVPFLKGAAASIEPGQ